MSVTRIDSLGDFGRWLSSSDGNQMSPVKVDPVVVDAIGRSSGVISSGAGSDNALRRASLILFTMAEHARGSDRLPTYAAWVEHSNPGLLERLGNLLIAIDGAQGAGEGETENVAEALSVLGGFVGNDDGLDLVNLTLAFAARGCRRYAQSEFPVVVSDIEAFRRIPHLRRSDVEADFPSICVEGEAVDFYTATSATTTGRSLLVPHCKAENEMLATYVAALSGGKANPVPTGQAPVDRAPVDRAPVDQSPFGMTLRLMPAGRLIGAPLGTGNTVLAAYETNAIRENIWDLWDYIAGQVFAEFPTPSGMHPINTIHATPAFGLILLTKYMLQRGLDPSESNVRHLLVTGSWIGPKTRNWLCESWKAELHTTYSCSELVGSAVECPKHPGRYHFGMHVMPEIIRPDGKHAEIGEQGQVLMTGLFPFHRSAMFMRYEVGDWGRWCGTECDCGARSPAMELLGRTGDILWFTSRDGTRWPIPPVPIRNALDRFDCVPKIPRPQYKMRLIDGAVPRLQIDVECYALAGSAWRKRISNAIAEAIQEEDPSIRTLMEAGELDLGVDLFFRSKLTNSTSVI